MENIQNVAAEAAQNAAMQQVMNPVNGAEVQANVPAPEGAVAKPKSKLEVATGNSYADQHDAFGTHFGKTMKEVDALLKRVDEQLANLPRWQANLEALKAELKQKKAAENFEELKVMFAFLTPEQKAALAAI